MLSTFSTFANVLFWDKSPRAEGAKTDPPPGHTYEGTQTTAWFYTRPEDGSSNPASVGLHIWIDWRDVYIYVYIYIYVYVYVDVDVYMCVYIYIYIYIHALVYYQNVCVCIHVYMYIYIYIYICTYAIRALLVQRYLSDTANTICCIIRRIWRTPVLEKSSPESS